VPRAGLRAFGGLEAASQKDQDDLLAFLDSPEGTAGTSEPDDVVSSDASALLHLWKSQNGRPTGCKRAKRQSLSEAAEPDPAKTEGADCMRTIAFNLNFSR
jgi:hypothetical protein